MSKNFFENNTNNNFNGNNLLNISVSTINESTIEETSIKNLIKEIYDLTQKINKLNSPKEQDNIIEPKLKKLSSLNFSKKNLENNITEIKKALSIEAKKNEISQEHKKVLINELNQKIFEVQNKMNLLNKNYSSFNSIQLIKYIYENKIIYNTDFLSRQQIKNFLEKKDYISNTDEIKKILKEKEVNKIAQNIIEKNILEKNLQKNQLEENLKMLDEEKNILEDELNDILAYKEYIESLMRLFNDKIMGKNNNQEILNEPVEILFNELANIDSEKAAMRICEELYNLLILNNQKNENINDKFFQLNHNNNSFIISNIEQKNKGSDSFEFTKLNNKTNKQQKRSESNSVSKRNTHDKKELININILKNDEQRENLDKKMLKRLIKNEIDTFINTQKISDITNNNYDNDKNLLNDFLFNLSMIIINKIKSILSKENKKIFISSNDIMIYLSLFFKLFYYEKLFDNNNTFINKDYNLIKKSIINKLSEIEKEKTKLEEKLSEVKLRQKIDKILEELIYKKNKVNEESKCDEEYYKLNKDELAYIDICKEYNDLVEQNEKIKNENEKNNTDFNNKKKDIEIKIDEYNCQINLINNEIKEINNYIENNSSKNNEQIINYKKIIDDKFNKIKTELNSYKNKYHDNIEKYNNFLGKINNMIKSSNLDNNFSLDNCYNNNESKIFNGSENLNELKSTINYNYYNNNFNTNNKKIKNGYFNEGKEPYMNINIKKLNKSMTIVKTNNTNNFPLYDSTSYNNTNKSFLFKNTVLNNSKNLEEETKSNYNIPIKQKKQNIYNIYNISLLPNVINKNKSTTNIHTRIKEIKEIKKLKPSNKKIPISNKQFPSKNFSTILSESVKTKSKINNKNNSTSFSHKKNMLNINNKLTLLKNSIICYFREIPLEENKNAIKYNPLNNIDFEILCASPYNFIRAKMNLNEKEDLINIKIYKEKKNLEIKLNDIENIVINSNIKKIIEIYRNYNKNKFNNNFSFEEFVNKEKNKFNDMNKEDIIKSALNQNFSFSIVTKNGKRLEFIIRSYEEFKIWINGMAFIIKNKNNNIE